MYQGGKADWSAARFQISWSSYPNLLRIDKQRWNHTDRISVFLQPVPENEVTYKWYQSFDNWVYLCNNRENDKSNEFTNCFDFANRYQSLFHNSRVCWNESNYFGRNRLLYPNQHACEEPTFLLSNLYIKTQ